MCFFHPNERRHSVLMGSALRLVLQQGLKGASDEGAQRGQMATDSPAKPGAQAWRIAAWAAAQIFLSFWLNAMQGGGQLEVRLFCRRQIFNG